MEALPFILASVVLTVAAQILVKQGLNRMDSPVFNSGLLLGYLRIYSSPLVLLGSGLYMISILLWMYSLSKTQLSFAYPFVSLSYVLIIIASRFILGESVPAVRWIGILVILIGIVLVSRS
jgi:drug/metabolite transporter (DMT)-like permease